jgi:hypothetical protein
MLRFKEYNQQIKFPFVIYADFETLTSKVNIECTSKTKIFQNHIVCSYGYVIIDSNKDIVFSEFYRGEDANEKFLYSIKRESEKLTYYLYHGKKLKMTKDDRISFKAAKFCSLCGLEFKRFERKNRDHGKTFWSVISPWGRAITHELLNLETKVKYRWTLLLVPNSLICIMTLNHDP